MHRVQDEGPRAGLNNSESKFLFYIELEDMSQGAERISDLQNMMRRGIVGRKR